MVRIACYDSFDGFEMLDLVVCSGAARFHGHVEFRLNFLFLALEPRVKFPYLMPNDEGRDGNIEPKTEVEFCEYKVACFELAPEKWGRSGNHQKNSRLSAQIKA